MLQTQEVLQAHDLDSSVASLLRNDIGRFEIATKPEQVRICKGFLSLPPPFLETQEGQRQTRLDPQVRSGRIQQPGNLSRCAGLAVDPQQGLGSRKPGSEPAVFKQQPSSVYLVGPDYRHSGQFR